MTNLTDLPETYYTDVVGCSRCNGHHPSLLFKKFSQQPASFAAGITHWAMCPVKNEPILLEMTEDPPSPQPIEQQQPQQQGLQQANATCDDIPPGPLSEHDLIEQWNAQADQYHQWESLESFEQLAWAQSRAIARDRNLHASSLIEKQDNIDALLTAFHHAYSAYGWVTHQQFSLLFDEAARLASVVEEDWDASVYPFNFNTQAQAAAVLLDHHHNLVRQIATEGQIRGAVLYLISTKHLDIIDPPPAIKYAIEYAIARWGVPATTPVPTGDDSAWRQQLGWSNSNGECWWSPGPQGPWQLTNPDMVYPAGWLLPYRAISQPAPRAALNTEPDRPTLAEAALCALERIQHGDASSGSDDFDLVANALGQLRRYDAIPPAPYIDPQGEDADKQLLEVFYHQMGRGLEVHPAALLRGIRGVRAFQFAPATPPALSATSKITGLAWPQTLGDWNLMGPPNRLGAWRWYRRTVYQDGHPAKQGGYPIEQEVKMDSQLQPMWESLVEVDNLDGPPSTFPALSPSPATPPAPAKAESGLTRQSAIHAFISQLTKEASSRYGLTSQDAEFDAFTSGASWAWATYVTTIAGGFGQAPQAGEGE